MTLGSVDDQALPDEAAAYDELTEEMQPFAFTEPRPSEPAYVLSLGGNWLGVRLNAHGRCLSLSPGSVVQSGMSGSPLVYADGSVVGVAVTNEGPHPMLAKATPRWCDLA
ncbi:hypothetical protein IVB08_33115 [Bradyrhizobium sp. 173]|uniref:hypothetical protein n=1 Tax=Bradyrhizobium sp. 173 TaxID=2782644 RepID=UPI001FF8A6FE|nr:hypothetical protein [Bradyrhizobium sp. 173]MCK1568708.1 hypothetical protein [Bradyrhizobium sp. 173]